MNKYHFNVNICKIFSYQLFIILALIFFSALTFIVYSNDKILSMNFLLGLIICLLFTILLTKLPIGFLTDFEIEKDNIIIKGYHDYFLIKCHRKIKLDNLVIFKRVQQKRISFYIVDKKSYFHKNLKSYIWKYTNHTGLLTFDAYKEEQLLQFEGFLKANNIEIYDFYKDYYMKRDNFNFILPGH